MDRNALLTVAIGLRADFVWASDDDKELFNRRLDEYFELRHSADNEVTCGCTFFTCVTVTETNRMIKHTFEELLSALGELK